MNGRTDQELLREYAGSGSEAAFSEVVRRYVDLVYSVALRVVGNAQVAEEVSQGVFLALAQNAPQLTARVVLPGWLHGTAHNLAANAVRSEVRRRAREEEAVVMNELSTDEPESSWESIAPHLDAALGQLSEPDRDAVLMRYFQRKSAREMAQILGVSAEAAQKRVNRAVDRLRNSFAKRGLVVGSNGLVVLLGARAVQSAPVGLALTISSTVLSGVSISTSTVIAATRILFMTTLQKALITSAVLAVLGTGFYEIRQNRLPRGQVQAPQQAQPLKARSETPGLSPGAYAVAEPSQPSDRIPAQRPAAAPPKKFKPVGFRSTELYALLTNKPARLTLAQVEPYLNARKRDSTSLLAAFRTTGDPTLLAEAMQKYPGDPRVGFEAATRNDASPADRRAGLDAFKQAAPDNALANYLSALDYFKTGHKDEAVQELNAAASKPQFEDYTLERGRTDEEVYLGAGYPAGEARMIANWFLPEAHLSQVRELGQNVVDLSASYQQAGDPSSREVALQMALDLGQRLDDPSGGEAMRWQLIGIRVERAALGVMEPASSLAGTGQLVQSRLDQLAGQMNSIQALTQQADPIWKTLTDEDWAQYISQMKSSGEEAAVRWLVSTHGHN